jgi:predicted dehydrogenase
MNFGVVGWGLRASIAKQAHRPEAGHRLVALADPDNAAHARFKEFAGKDVITVHHIEALMDQPLDALFILSPDYLHEAHAILALESGIPVYLEKPMAITTEGCDRILRVAKQTGTKLYLGHNMRHFPIVRKMRELIIDGAIGEVKTAWCRHFVSYGGEAYFQDWHADRKNTTGLLLQKGAHDIDVLHWLCSGYSKRVSAMGKLAVYGEQPVRLTPDERITVSFRNTWPPLSLQPLNSVVDVEDISMMLMELDNGVLASYQQCHFTPDAWRNYTVIGTEGRIENFGDVPGNGTIKLWDTPGAGWREVADHEWKPIEVAGTHGGADSLIMEEFLRFLEFGGETDTSPIAARMAVAAGVSATKSLRNGSLPIEVEPLAN